METLSFESFAEQCGALGQILRMTQDTHNTGEFSAVVDGKTIRVFGGDNLLGTQNSLVGTRLVWEIKAEGYALLKMASGNFVQMPSLQRFFGESLTEALEKANRQNEDVPTGYSWRDGCFWHGDAMVPIY